MIDLSNWDFINRLTKCSTCGSRKLEINTALSSVINIYWGLFCPMFRQSGGEYSFCWTTWCYVDGKHNIMADLQASVGWRRGINNAPCRHWPPVLILLVDLGELSPLQLTLGAEWSLIIAKFPHHCGDSPLVWKLWIESNLLLLSREVQGVP